MRCSSPPGDFPADRISTVSGTGYAGRQRELAALKGVLDEALSGHGRLVMLVGEPGIGKTRLAQELSSIAESRGVRVMWGRCYEEQGVPPYWPDAELEVKALAVSCNMDLFHLQHAECRKNGNSAIELADQVEDMDSVVCAHYFVGVSLASFGEVSQARRHGEAGLALLDRPIRGQQQTITLFLNQFIAYLEGKWAAVREFANRGLSMNTSSPAPYLLGVIALTEAEEGNTDRANSILDDLLANMRRVPAGTSWEWAASSAVLPMAARITGVTERLAEADAIGEAVLSAPNLGPWIAHRAHMGRALTSLQRNDERNILAERYANLGDTVGMPSLFGTTPDRVLGLLSHAMGDPDQAAIHFNAAYAFCQKAGYRPELAWTCCDFADTLLQRASTGLAQRDDRYKAMALLEESLAIATELGMPPLMERVQSRLDGLASSPSATPAYPDGLTQREVEVLNLIAQGKSNREIGEALVISEGTVRRHINNTYDKIGVGNRAEATRYALQRGLVQVERERP